jgi:hypothetical protein
MNTAPDTQELANRLAREAVAGRIAAANPLPDVLAEVFAPDGHIRVKDWNVRPVYDADIEALVAWQHPFGEWLIASIAGQEIKPWVPRGPDAWVLFWMFTNPVEHVDAVIAQPQGREAAYREAIRAFRRLTLRDAMALYEAVLAQTGLLQRAELKYEPDTGGERALSDTGEGKVTRVVEDPGSPAVAPTGSAGS